METEDHSVLRQLIRASGLRATAPRVAVLALLRRQEGPITHGEVVEQLERDGWDRATLYRNLTDLTRVSLVRRTDVGDHVWRFEAAREKDHGIQHPHFLCTTCGTVECVPDVEVNIPHRSGGPSAFQSGKLEVQIKGVCDDCG